MESNKSNRSLQKLGVYFWWCGNGVLQSCRGKKILLLFFRTLAEKYRWELYSTKSKANQSWPSYYKKLASDFGKKYKEKYRLTIEQSIGLNKGNLITFFEDARVTLVQKDNGINLYYTKAEHPTYKIYSPKDISSDEF